MDFTLEEFNALWVLASMRAARDGGSPVSKLSTEVMRYAAVRDQMRSAGGLVVDFMVDAGGASKLATFRRVVDERGVEKVTFTLPTGVRLPPAPDSKNERGG
jgi:hypothetical protein